MKSIEYLTALVLAKRSLDLDLKKDVVLWADLLLAQGFDRPEVKNLICLDPAASKAQVEKLVDDCLTSFHVSLVDEKPAHLLLMWAWTQKLLKAETTADEFLQMMQQYCLDFEHEPVYMQFYLLHCAKKDLDSKDPSKTTIMFHDREINDHNFEQVLQWEIDLFLEQYEPQVLEFIRIKSEK